jgi:hypothetical protein
MLSKAPRRPQAAPTAQVIQLFAGTPSVTVSNVRLEMALEYAGDQDLFIFPVPPGTKKSYWEQARAPEHLPWGMTKNLARLERFFRRHPEAGIGLPTGATNRFFVLDVDTPKGHGVDGTHELQELVRQAWGAAKNAHQREP